MRSSRRMSAKTCLALFFLILLPLILAAGCGGSYITQKTNTLPTQENTKQAQGNGVAGVWPVTAEEAEAEQNKWFAANTDQVATIEDARIDIARKLVPAKEQVLQDQKTADASASSKGASSDFSKEVTTRATNTALPRIDLPKLKSLGTPTGIFVLKKQGIARAMMTGNSMYMVTAKYANGIKVYYSPKSDGLAKDYAAIVANSNNPANQDSGEHTSLPRLVTVHGFQGIGQEPGYDYFQELGDKHLRCSNLEWTDSEGTYTIRSPLLDQTVSLTALIQIAESMY
jgi:hypothetical protein